jgi:hypothetical protein
MHSFIEVLITIMITGGLSGLAGAAAFMLVMILDYWYNGDDPERTGLGAVVVGTYLGVLVFAVIWPTLTYVWWPL